MTVKEDTSEAQTMKEMMLRLAPAAVRSKLEEYLRRLREGMLGASLPSKVNSNPSLPK